MWGRRLSTTYLRARWRVAGPARPAHAVIELIVNAIQAMRIVKPTGRRITVIVLRSGKEPG
jgi:hypothetical protein